MNRQTSHLDPIDKELIEQKFSNVYLKIDSNHNETKILLEKILEQATKTNGRVTLLESTTAKKEQVDRIEQETEFIRVIPKYKKFMIFAIVGIWTIFSGLGVVGLLKWI